MEITLQLDAESGDFKVYTDIRDVNKESLEMIVLFLKMLDSKDIEGVYLDGIIPWVRNGETPKVQEERQEILDTVNEIWGLINVRGKKDTTPVVPPTQVFKATLL